MRLCLVPHLWNRMAQDNKTRKESSLVVKVLRSTSHRGRFWWIVRNDRDGQIVESSFQTYPNEDAARRAAEVAVRVIRRRPW